MYTSKLIKLEYMILRVSSVPDSDDGKIKKLLTELQEDKPEESNSIKKDEKKDDYDSYVDTTKDVKEDEEIPEEAFFD